MKIRKKNFGRILENELITNLIFNDENKNDNLQKLIEYFRLSDQPFRCFYIQSSDHSEISYNTFKLLRSRFRSRWNLYFGAVFFDRCIFFAFNELLNNSQTVEAFSNDLRMLSLDKFQQRVEVHISPVAVLLSEIVDLYRDLYKKIIADHQSVSESLIPSLTFEAGKLQEKSQVLIKLIIEMNSDSALHMVNEVYQYLQELTGHSEDSELVREYMKHLYLLTVEKTYNLMDKRINSDVVKKNLSSFDNMETGKKIKRFIADLINELIYEIRSNNDNPGQSLVKPVKKYLSEHFSEELNLQSVADLFNVSFGHLSKCFKKVEGISFSEYLMNLRIEEAKKLLKKDYINISEVAEKVGYADPGYFSKVFKKQVGMTPKQYSNL